MATKMMACKTCGEQIATSAKSCPKCGAKNKKPIYKKVWFWVAIVVIVIIIAASSGAGGTSSTNSGNNTASANDTNKNSGTKKEKFEIIDGVNGITVEQDMFSLYFSGVIQNNTNKKYSYVQIEISLYDADGALLGTALDNVNNLEANGKWKFKATSFLSSDLVEEVASWKVTEITGW